ncbi:hypothetical protein MSAN_00121600 [Mycena sanguinolenta]|uniref:Protein kinase domain-containing protein n=1 Tax=Mycena sanguinolenta TaxID=230812 RepID=A0A8H7DK06_9AGAR|nr:hypothetical protein MSAN_00121600 [Mycena sanguinolenta]
MDDHSQPEPECTHSSTCDVESPSAASRHASGMFSHSRQFTVTGKTFTNVTNNYAAPTLPSDFRMIPMGDIDLRHQIRVDDLRADEWNVSNPQLRGRACVRRVHSAKVVIGHRRSRVTVAMYEGNDAEEEWRNDLAKYMRLRHPNIVQICGAASSNGMHVTLFNDDLIPLQEVLDRYRDSHFSTVYIYACCNQDFTQAINYLRSAIHSLSPGYMRWIRHSTGRLCTELTPVHDNLKVWVNPPELPSLSGMYPLNAGAEIIMTFIDSLTLEQYHHICCHHLSQYRRFDVSASTTVNLGAVFHYSSNLLDDSDEIAFLPGTKALLFANWRIFEGRTGEVMPNGWTRFQSGDVINNTLYLSSSIYSYRATWLSQANYIFRRLNIMANLEDYVVVDENDFHLHVSQTTRGPPEGFLFLCPREDFQTGPSSFRFPTCPAYWSADPSGIDRLSPEEATRLGFPSFELTAAAVGRSWDTSVYEGLRQFHEAKGFDPYSQDVARHLGHSLYEVSSRADAPFAYDDEDFDADIDSDCDSAYPDDYESESLLSAGDDSADLDVETESLHSEADFHDPAGENRGPESAEISNYANHNASGSTLEEDMVAEEILVPSPTFRIVLYIQLTAISFLAFSWVYNQVW